MNFVNHYLVVFTCYRPVRSIPDEMKFTRYTGVYSRVAQEGSSVVDHLFEVFD